ncbi:MAG: dihydrodipicolinate synthase family protein [Isosphaeraceae bacterium]|nr:dihydrodipicolinate synthase family protein [Isosphaeraceae bacterium]
MDSLELAGKLIPAVPVPFDELGRIHSDAQAAYVAWMAAMPIGGVAVWAHTGRGLLLEESDRDRVLREWRAGLPLEIPVIAAAGPSPNQRRPDLVIASARAMADRAAELGASALLVHPPRAFRGRPDQDRLVLEYHDEIARAGLPLILFYLYEGAGGISYGPVVLTQLLARGDVLGIKVATLDRVITYQEIAELIERHAADKLLITGEDRFLGYSAMIGARAALIGMAAARVRLQARFLQAYWNGDATTFLRLNRDVDLLARRTFVAPMEGYIQRMLWCLAIDGVIPREATHDPWGPKLGKGEFEVLERCLGQLGPDA